MSTIRFNHIRPKILSTLTFRLPPEVFIRRMKSSFLHHKEELEQTSECVYKVPCANCKKTYVGETGRKLVVRLQEHRTEVESKNKRIFTRSQRSGTSTEYNTSALTDRPCSTRKPCDKLGGGISDRQGTRQTYQMDQGGNPHPQGRTTSHELGEMMTSFF